MDSTASLGEWLRRWRRARGMTREEVAEQVPCSVVTIRKIEADERRPSRELAARVADVLRLPAEAHARFLESVVLRVGPGRLPLPDGPAAGGGATPPVPAGGSHLPIPPTPLIGREQELSAATALVLRDGVRLLTLT